MNFELPTSGRSAWNYRLERESGGGMILVMQVHKIPADQRRSLAIILKLVVRDKARITTTTAAVRRCAGRRCVIRSVLITEIDSVTKYVAPLTTGIRYLYADTSRGGRGRGRLFSSIIDKMRK